MACKAGHNRSVLPLIMGNALDLTGQTFGRLTVLSRAERVHGRTAYLCRCECGSEVVKTTHAIAHRNIRSCGCLRKEVSAKHASTLNVTHGLTSKAHTPRWYVIWSGMMKRCYNKNSATYPRYGGRGISVCHRWHDPRNFLADMGEPLKSQSIDRIDNDGPYSPDNCRWADCEVQANNKSNVVLLTYSGVTDTLSGWSKRTGIPRTALHTRYYNNWPIERMLTEDPRVTPG